MMKKNIAIILRVFSRMEDLNINIDIINNLWKTHNYSTYVIFNGSSAGYALYEGIEDEVTKVVSLDKNAGHLKGNSQLLLNGMESLDDDFDYIIIIEADTWLMGDEIVDKYIKKLENIDAVWASSEWIESRHSVGLDFAIIKTEFLKKNYKKLFDFSINPEMYIAENLLKDNKKIIFIDEMMPIHRPSIVKSIYNADGGRLRIFPKAKMVTHHCDKLSVKIEDKKLFADIVYGNNFFTNKPKFYLLVKKSMYICFNVILKYLPRSRWFKKKKSTFNLYK